MALLGFARPGTSITVGTVTVGGRDLLSLGEADLSRARGRVDLVRAAEPGAGAVPRDAVGRQLEEMLDSRAPRRPSARRAAEAPGRGRSCRSTAAMLGRYPHQLSGGQQQRVVDRDGARSIRKCIVMDEPTTGLDVITQERLLDVIAGLREQRGTSIVYVSHDLGVVRNLVDAVAVMYAGHIVETARSRIFRDPRHPYTRRLLEAIPRVRHDTRRSAASRGARWSRGTAAGLPVRAALRHPHRTGATSRCRLGDRCAAARSARALLAGGEAVECSRVTPRRWRAAELGLPRAAAPALLVVAAISSRATRQAPRRRQGASRMWRCEASPSSSPAGAASPSSARAAAARRRSGAASRAARPIAGEMRFDGEPLGALAQDRRARRCAGASSSSSRTPTARSTRTCRSGGSSGGRCASSSISRDAEEAARVAELLEQVRLPPSVATAAARAQRRPEAAGRDRPRARRRADLLICDEVTSALDVAVQASILELLAELRRSTGAGDAVHLARPRRRQGDQRPRHRHAGRRDRRAPTARRSSPRPTPPTRGSSSTPSPTSTPATTPRCDELRRRSRRRVVHGLMSADRQRRDQQGPAMKITAVDAFRARRN